MKKIKIGIPRALLYYRYGTLWKNYFERLGCKIILSPETNHEILELGNKYTKEETCMSYKIYIGHTLYLIDKCDYILVSGICNYGKNNKVCSKYKETYEYLKDKVLKESILFYEVNHTAYKYEFFEFVKMGLKISKNIFKITHSYIVAKQKQEIYDINKINEAKNKITKLNKKILLISHFYILDDKYFSNYIIEYLKKNNIITIKANSLDSKTATRFSEYFSGNIDIKYTKELIGSLYYYKYQVDGIIYISEAHCKIDSFINNTIINRNKEIPIINILIAENTSKESIERQLLTFTNAIKANK